MSPEHGAHHGGDGDPGFGSLHGLLPDLCTLPTTLLTSTASSATPGSVSAMVEVLSGLGPVGWSGVASWCHVTRCCGTGCPTGPTADAGGRYTPLDTRARPLVPLLPLVPAGRLGRGETWSHDTTPTPPAHTTDRLAATCTLPPTGDQRRPC